MQVNELCSKTTQDANILHLKPFQQRPNATDDIHGHSSASSLFLRNSLLQFKWNEMSRSSWSGWHMTDSQRHPYSTGGVTSSMRYLHTHTQFSSHILLNTHLTTAGQVKMCGL